MKGQENIIGKGFDKNPHHINRNGRPKVLPELKAILLEDLSESKEGLTKLEAIIKRLTSMATKGDMRAIQEVFDRLYGKAQQNIKVEDEQRPTIQVINVSQVYPEGLPENTEE